MAPPMGFINLAEKTISAKLVYYGPGMGGKTTSLQHVHKVMCARDDVQLVSIKTDDDATLMFDFLPIDVGLIDGFQIRIQGFTVPGQPKYRRMRRYVLQGADAVVLVVDSQSSRLQENLQSLDSLRENLRANHLDPQTLPIVLQYNKRDLADILAEAELDRHIKWRDGLQSFPSVAHEGYGVFETFVHAAGLIIEAKVRQYKLGRGAVAPESVAHSVRTRLWQLHDQVMGGDASTATSERVEVTIRRDEQRAEAVTELPPHGEVISDAELQQSVVGPMLPAASDALALPVQSAPAVTDEPPEELLDDAIQTNVELAAHFGELDRYKTLLERKNQELVQVAQNTVHDLNRPLAVIKLMLSSMQRGLFGDVEGKLKDAVENGLHAVGHMGRLITELLDSSRLDDDGVALAFGEVDAHLLVAEVLRTFRLEIEERDAVCTVEPLPILCADEWALTKAFMNLIGNALQYAHTDRRLLVRVSAELDKDRIVFIVADNGIGIPRQDLPRLFRRFERGSNTGGRAGTGLGLHIVREIALGHGGEVWCESSEGEGTKFMLALPLAPAMPPRSPVADVVR